VDDGEPHNVDMESDGNGALDIYDDALVIAYDALPSSFIDLNASLK
jgi:hypothetical protein